jgi:hypothetical protein
MTTLQVECITKHPSHHDPHERIQGIGGTGDGGWWHAEDDAIRNIERGVHSYFVMVNGRQVNVVVATHKNRKYLKTTADGYEPNNLLNLPECRR